MSAGFVDAAIYIHFPYCLRKCPYCDFSSIASSRAAIDHFRYARSLVQELDQRLQHCDTSKLTFRSIYIGGGTPSLWDPAALQFALAQICERFCLKLPSLEVSAECNPSSFDESCASAMRDCGINRFSLGVQSLNDQELRFLGRLHDAQSAVSAVSAAVKSGCRVSADLIYGLPDQDQDRVVDFAKRLVGVGVGHLSAYLLGVEPNTPFGEMLRAGAFPQIDESKVVASYLGMSDAMVAQGFEHYEVSSYALAGHHCLHNEIVWRGGQYLGLGSGAVGCLQLRDGRRIRYTNSSNPERYMTELAAGHDPFQASALLDALEVVDDSMRLQELIMLGLRLAEGVDIDAAGQDAGLRGWTAAREREVSRLLRLGRICKSQNRVWIPRREWIWENDTTARLL